MGDRRHWPYRATLIRGHRFILAATDYFSKWAEVVPLREVKSDNVINFLERHIIYRFGIPYRVTSDNGKAFKSGKMLKFVEKYKIKWNFSTGYYPQANGAIEAFNKTLGKILKKTATRHRRDWPDRLYEALWAYRATVRTPTQATPYSLVYGSEAVLPLEIQLPSLRVAIHEELTQDEQIQLRYWELDALEEARLNTLQNLELYRQNMVRAYDKLVKRRVYRKRRGSTRDGGYPAKPKEIRGMRPSWRRTGGTPGGRRHTLRPCQDGRRAERFLRQRCAQVDRCIGSSAERFRCPVDGCPGGGVYELAVQISEAMLWSSSRPRCGRYHGVVAMSPHDPAEKAFSRIRGAMVLPQTIRAVDRGVVDGSEVAVPRTLTWPCCRGGTEPSTRMFAATRGGDVDPGTLATGTMGSLN
ncbi:hypothetical protein QYE76_044059 [Lolium multiflorum]|uniref:Integrase catalytic domain-containing protein n=1 Tax=Lolium multiflorum TaxID=4521 RepID=A0AAD8TIJ0_LOLMU|nr:hypothetical protein QYE76_044059 [Lolium multiflorum]